MRTYYGKHNNSKLHNSKAYRKAEYSQNPHLLLLVATYEKKMYQCECNIRQGEAMSLSHSSTTRSCVIMLKLRKLLTSSLKIIFLLRRKRMISLSLEYNDFYFFFTFSALACFRIQSRCFLCGLIYIPLQQTVGLSCHCV